LIGAGGKYDDCATMVREHTGARGVAVLVIGGKRGSGFAVHGDFLTMATLPKLLEEMARQIRADMEQGHA